MFWVGQHITPCSSGRSGGICFCGSVAFDRKNKFRNGGQLAELVMHHRLFHATTALCTFIFDTFGLALTSG